MAMAKKLQLLFYI